MSDIKHETTGGAESKYYDAKFDLENSRVVVGQLAQRDESVIVGPAGRYPTGGLVSYTHDWAEVNKEDVKPTDIAVRGVRGGMSKVILIEHWAVVEGVTELKAEDDDNGSLEWLISVEDEEASYKVMQWLRDRFQYVYEERARSEVKLKAHMGGSTQGVRRPSLASDDILD